MKIDLTTIVGLILSICFVATGMLVTTGHDLSLLVRLYINQPEAASIVFGGSLCAILGSFPFSKFKQIGKILTKTFLHDEKNTAYKELIQEIVEYATKARRHGVLALEGGIEKIQDPFIKNGIQLAVDGTAPEQIEEIMHLELDHMKQRHSDHYLIFVQWAQLAPSFGLIGTLIGLIGMLANLSNPDLIGPSMATALVTTLYGAALANMVLIPVFNKLESRSKEEVVRKEIIISGILAIQSGDNPRIVQQKLVTYVTNEVRGSVMAATATEQI